MIFIKAVVLKCLRRSFLVSHHDLRSVPSLRWPISTTQPPVALSADFLSFMPLRRTYFTSLRPIHTTQAVYYIQVLFVRPNKLDFLSGLLLLGKPAIPG
jgi:hypothetical protein